MAKTLLKPFINRRFISSKLKSKCSTTAIISSVMVVSEHKRLSVLIETLTPALRNSLLGVHQQEYYRARMPVAYGARFYSNAMINDVVQEILIFKQ